MEGQSIAPSTQTGQTGGSRAETTATGMMNRKFSNAANMLFTSLSSTFWTPFFSQVTLVVGYLQIVSLLVNPNWPWGKIIGGIGVPLYFTVLPLWDSTTRMAASYLGVQVLVWILWLMSFLMFIVLLLLLWEVARQRTRHGTKVFIGLVQVLGGGVLFQPALHAFISNLVCDGNGHLYAFPTRACWTDSISLLHFVISIIGLLFLGIAHVIATFVLFDDLPRSPFFQSRAHNLFDAAESAVKITLIVLYHVMIPRGQQQAFAGIAAAAGLALTAVLAARVPYYHQLTTQLKGAGYLGLSAIGIFSCIMYEPQSPTELHSFATNWDALVVVTMFGLAFLLGFVGTSFRLSRDCIYNLYHTVTGNRVNIKPQSLFFPKNLPELEHGELQDLENLMLGEMVLNTQTLVEQEMSAVKEWTDTYVAPFLDNIIFDTDIEASTRFLTIFVNHTGENPPVAWVAFALRIFSKGVGKFGQSLLLKLHLTTFLGSFSPGRAQLALRLCENYVKLPHTGLLGLRFNKRISQLSAAMNLRDHTHRTLLNQALRLHREALVNMTHFWAKLQAEQVDMSRLSELAKSITESREQGTSFFDRVLNEASDTFALVRYSRFLEEIMMDTDAAETAREVALEVLQAEVGADGGSETQSVRRRKTLRANKQDTSKDTSASTTSDTIRFGMNCVFALLVAVCLGLLAYGVWLSEERGTNIEMVSAAGYARTLAQESGVLVHRLERLSAEHLPIVTGGGTYPQSITDTYAVLQDRIDEFRRIYFSLRVGAFKTDASIFAHRFFAVRGGERRELSSVWRVADVFISLVDSILAADRNLPLASTSPTEIDLLTQNTLQSVAAALNFTVTSLEEETAAFADTGRTTFTIFFAAILASLIAIHAFMTLGFGKISRSKLLTLSLFTLIPKVTLEKLQDENQTKVNGFDEPDPRFEEAKKTLGIETAQDEMEGAFAEVKEAVQDDDEDGELDEAIVQSKFALMAKNADKADIGSNKLEHAKKAQKEIPATAVISDSVPAPIVPDTVGQVSGKKADASSDERRGMQAKSTFPWATFFAVALLLIWTGAEISITALAANRTDPSAIMQQQEHVYLPLREDLNALYAQVITSHSLVLRVLGGAEDISELMAVEGRVMRIDQNLLSRLIEVDSLDDTAVSQRSKITTFWSALSRMQRVILQLSCASAQNENELSCDAIVPWSWTVSNMRVPHGFSLPLEMQNCDSLAACNITTPAAAHALAISLVGSDYYRSLYTRTTSLLTTFSLSVEASRVVHRDNQLSTDVDTGRALMGLSWSVLGFILLFDASYHRSALSASRSKPVIIMLICKTSLAVALVGITMSFWSIDQLTVPNYRRFFAVDAHNETFSRLHASYQAAAETVLLGSHKSQLRFDALVLRNGDTHGHFVSPKTWEAASSTVVPDLQSIAQSLHRLRDWEAIAIAIASSASNIPLTPALSLLRWSVDDDLTVTNAKLHFPTQLWYNNVSHDITFLTAADQKNLSHEMIFGSYLMPSLEVQIHRLDGIHDSIVDELHKHLHTLGQDETALLNAARAVAGVMLFVQLLLVLTMIKDGVDNAQSQGRKSESSSENDDLLQQLTTRSKVAVSLLSVMVLVVYLVSYLTLSTSQRIAMSQTAASARSVAIAKTANVLQKTSGLLDIPGIQSLYRMADGAASEFMFGTKGKGTGMAMQYGDVTQPLFGVSSKVNTRFTCAVDPNYVAAPSVDQTLPFLLQHAVDIAARYWERLTELVATASSLSTAVGVAEDATVNVTHSLRLVASQYDSNLILDQQTNQIVFICLMVVLLLLIALEYLFVYRPIIVILRNEEAGTKLMLKMIPVDVRDSVPAIAEYLTTGIVSTDMKLVEINDAAANLSTLPVITIDSTGTISRFSKAAEEAFQWNRTEVIGKNVSMLMPENIAVEHDAYLHRYNRTGVQHVLKRPTKVRAMRKDRTLFPAELVVKEHRVNGKMVFVGSIRNISVDMEFERATVLSKAVSEAATVPIIVINTEGIIQRFNVAAENTFKYQARDIVGKKINNLMTSTDAEAHDNYLATYKKIRVKHVIDSVRQVQAKKSNGDIFHAELNVRELIQAEGSVYIGYVEDLTSKLEFQLAMRVNDAIATTSPVPVIEIDELGTVITWSPSAGSTFQIPSQEMVGRNIKMVMPQAIAAKHDGYLASYLKNGRKKMLDAGTVAQRALRREDNGTWSQFPIKLSVKELKRQGRGNTYIAYLQDSTEELELNHELQISDSLSNLSLLGIVTIDEKGIIQSFSRAARELFGYTTEEAVNQNVKILMPSDIARNHDDFLEGYRTHRVKTVIGSSRNVVAVRKNGTTVKIVLSVSEVSNGEKTLYVGYLRDVTAEIEMESANIANDAVFQLSTTPIIVMSNLGIITSCSEAACNTFLWTKDEIVGQNVKMLMPDSIAKDHDQILANYMTKLEEKGEEEVRKNSSVLGKERRVVAKTRDDVEFPAVLYAKDVHIPGQAPFFVGLLRNVEEELFLESQRRIADTIIEGSSIPLICIDPLGTVTVFSKAASSVFGYPKNEVVGKNVKMLQTEDVSRNHDGYLRAYAKTGQKTIIGSKREAIARRKDGTTINVLLQVQELTRMDDNGNAQKEFVAFVKDLTQENILNQANMINKVVYQLTSVPILSIDKVGTVLEVNEAAATEYGYTKSEIVGNNVKMLMPQSVAVNHDRYLENYAKTGAKHVIDNPTVQEARRKDGSTFAVELLVREMKLENGESQFIGYVQNITSRKQDIQRHLVNQSILELSPDPMVVADMNGIITHFSPSATACFGYSSEEAIGTNLKTLMKKESADKHDGYIANYLKTKVKHVIDNYTEVTAVRKGGEAFRAELFIREVLDAHGLPTFVGYLRNMETDLKLAYSQSLIEASKVASKTPCVVLDGIGLIQGWSVAGTELFGYSDGEVMGKNISILQPDELQRGDDRLADLTAITSHTSRKVKAKTKDGKVIHCQMEVRPTSAQFLVQLWSVEEQVENDRVAAEGTALISESPVPIIHISSRGTIEKINAAFTASFGYPESDLIDKNVKVLMRDEVAVNHDGYLKRYATTHEAHIINVRQEVEVKHKSGRFLSSYLLVKEVAVEGLESAYIGYLRDITNELEARRDHALQEDMNNNSPTPYVAISPLGSILQFPRSSEELFGYSAEEVLGQNIKMLTPPSVAVNHDSYLARYMSTRKKIIVDSSREVNARRKDGKEVQVELCLKEVLDDQGVPIMFVGYLRSRPTAIDHTDSLNIALTEGTPDGIVIIGEGGLIEDINPAALKLFGAQSKMTALGSNIKSYMPDAIAEHHDEYLRNYRRTKQKNIIDSIRRVTLQQKDTKKHIPVEIRVKELLVHGKPSRYLGYVREITTDLEQEHAAACGVVATDLSSHAVIVIATTDSRILTFSREAETMFSCKASDVIGESIKTLMPTNIAVHHDAYIASYNNTKQAQVLGTTRIVVGRKWNSNTSFEILLTIKEVPIEGHPDMPTVFIGWARLAPQGSVSR